MNLRKYHWKVNGQLVSFASALMLSAMLVMTPIQTWASNTPTAAIAMPDEYSAKVAEQILHQGGNAVDAAVAAAFVLAVTYPEAGNLGGGGFMTLYAGESSSFRSSSDDVPLDKTPRPYFLDYRETAPQAAMRDLYLDAKKRVVPYQSLIGYRASGVPGTVMGMWMAHQRFGSLAWKILLQPAIDYAQNGFIVPPELPKTFHWYQTWVQGKTTEPLNIDRYFGQMKANQLFKQPKLAQTLKRIADDGADDFYHGVTALQMVHQMQAHQGLITLEDLNHYQAKWRIPVQADWKGYQVVSAPPPSSGGVAIIQLLKMKALLDPQFQKERAKVLKNGGSVEALEAHFYAEMEKRVYADRAQYLGDPDFIKVPVKQLISDDYLSKRATEVNFEEISNTEDIQPGLPESPETTHFSIVDFNGNAVSNTYTLNMPFGNGVVIEEAGFLMNDEMDDFSTKPGVANVFGVLGGKANEIQPGKRMLSSMSPTLLLKDGQVVMAVGTPGGSSIITSVFQTIVNVLDKQMSAQDAVNATRVHHQLWPRDVIMYNPDLSQKTKDALSLMGYTLKKNNYLGDVQLVVKQQGQWQAASDERGRGEAKVFEDNQNLKPSIE